VKVAAIDPIAIADEEVWDWAIAGECLNHLLRRPFGCGIRRDIEVHDAAAVVGEDQEAVEQPECGGGHDEEIASDGLGHVILEEGAPALRRWPVLSPRHVLSHGGVTDLDAEQE